MTSLRDGLRDPARHSARAIDPADRRRVLTRSLAGSTVICATAFVPSSWTRPLVKAVVLPAHAQTSREPDPRRVTLSAANGDFPHVLPDDVEEIEFTLAGGDGGGGGGGAGGISSPGLDGNPGFAGESVTDTAPVSGGQQLSIQLGTAGSPGQGGNTDGTGGAGGAGGSAGEDGSDGGDQTLAQDAGGGGGGGEAGGDTGLLVDGSTIATALGGAGGDGGDGGESFNGRAGGPGGDGGNGFSGAGVGGTAGAGGTGNESITAGQDGGDGSAGTVEVSYTTAT